MKYSSDITPGDVIAVGDIHGRSDLLAEFVKWVSHSQAHVVFLGDLIDRGPNDLGVLSIIKLLRENVANFGLASVTVLRGNHEQMMLDASSGHLEEVSLWVQNGGDLDNAEAIFEHVSWVEHLPLYQVIDDTLFVHGGVMPGIPMPEQDPDDLIWIRKPFLKPGLDLSKVFPLGNVKRVVHGHTPWLFDDHREAAYPTRVNIDSFAYETGVLTTYNATTDTFHQIEGADVVAEEREFTTV